MKLADETRKFARERLARRTRSGEFASSPAHGAPLLRARTGLLLVALNENGVVCLTLHLEAKPGEDGRGSSTIGLGLRTVSRIFWLSGSDVLPV